MAKLLAKNTSKSATSVDNVKNQACQRGAFARESAGITVEDIARLALRRACLVSRFNPLTQMRMLWLRKRRRQRRRKRPRSRRRSSFEKARVEPRSARAPVRVMTIRRGRG